MLYGVHSGVELVLNMKDFRAARSSPARNLGSIVFHRRSSQICSRRIRSETDFSWRCLAKSSSHKSGANRSQNRH